MAESAGARVFSQPFLGDGKQKKLASEYSTNNWIFSLDADEYLDEDLIEELIQDHKDQSSLKKIEFLEKKLINNLDENSYSELIKLKSQLNRD